ncbi:PAS domain S-box protein [Sphingobacterium prati]|uniref:sensor histidine kinase n=1 Tax=Sphingobacterium prati TaxID=2737006 RepID=UPI001551E806|nr:PAS domain S-box protein [Sphingobacterium prati]NPE45680.1 PAS domain S-box protein [Sphingobacterium prati]
MNKIEHLVIQHVHNLNNMPILAVDICGIITYANNAACQLFHVENKVLLGQHLSRFFNFLKTAQSIQSEFVEKEPNVSMEVSLPCATGEERWGLVNSQPLADDNGQILVYFFIQDISTLRKRGNLQDITDQKVHKTLLKESMERQARLAAVVSTSDDAIISKTLTGLITSWNASAERMFGYTEAEVLGKHISLIIPADRIDEEEIIIRRISKGGRIEHFETVRIGKSGQKIYVSLSISPIVDGNGMIIGASKIARDISRQKEFEEKLQRYTNNVEILNTVGKLVSESLDVKEILQIVIDASTKIIGAELGIFIYHDQNKNDEPDFAFANSGVFSELLIKEKILESNFLSSEPNWEQVARSTDLTHDNLYKDKFLVSSWFKDQSVIKSYLGVPVVSKSGKTIGRLIYGHQEEGQFMEDQEKLVIGIATQTSTALQNAKLYEKIQFLNKKKDEFVGLASHELKTPITSLVGFLQLLSMRMQTGDINKPIVDKALKQSNRLSILIDDMLNVTKIESGQLSLSYALFDLGCMVQEIIEEVQYTTHSHHIEFHSEKPSFLISADKLHLEQVLVNLLNNAIKYSPGAHQVKVYLAEYSGYAILRVQDFGMGVPVGQQEHIFSRFYRAEGINPHISGLGLGLYISKEIIDRHGGELTVESQLGEGSIFVVKIPI